MSDICGHRWAVIRNDGAYCRDCGAPMKSIIVEMPTTISPILRVTPQDWKDGYAAGYAAAKAEMVYKLETFKPTYVEGGRVPEDAIEHRNQPRDTNA